MKARKPTKRIEELIELSLARLALAGCRNSVLKRLDRATVRTTCALILNPSVNNADVVRWLHVLTKGKVNHSASYRFIGRFAWAFDSLSIGEPYESARSRLRKQLAREQRSRGNA